MILHSIMGLGAGPLVSIFAAAISILFFVLTFRLSIKMADRSMNLEAHKMLFDIDRQMIADPKLWAFYDDHPIHSDPEFNQNPAQFRGKLEAFAYLQLNMFEIVLLEVPKPAKRKKRSPSKVWYDFFDDTLSRSTMMRSILDRPNSAQIYNSILLTLYDQWKVKAKPIPTQSTPPK